MGRKGLGLVAAALGLRLRGHRRRRWRPLSNVPSDGKRHDDALENSNRRRDRRVGGQPQRRRRRRRGGRAGRRQQPGHPRRIQPATATTAW